MDTRTIVISDLHGDHETCRRLLRQEGVLDEIDQRVPGWHVIQIGDLIHGGHNEYESDLAMTKKPWFDVVLLGNHELPHVFPRNGFPRFAGMTPLESRCTDALKGNLAAYAVGDWLITHAGLYPLMAVLEGVPPVASEAADFINERFSRRLTTTEPDPLFDAVGRMRGGNHPIGGIFWHDWRDMYWNPAQFPVKQIMGHTPRPNGFEHDPTGNLWCVDSGAALSGMVSALVSEGDGWRGTSYTRRKTNASTNTCQCDRPLERANSKCGVCGGRLVGTRPGAR